jgi:exodeoxyribonuclease VII small subunit
MQSGLSTGCGHALAMSQRIPEGPCLWPLPVTIPLIAIIVEGGVSRQWLISVSFVGDIAQKAIDRQILNARHKPGDQFIIAPYPVNRADTCMPPKKKNIDFEQSLSALEALVNRMEQGDMTLDESLQAFESGIALTRECQTRLAAAELQVTKLIEQQGNIRLEPFGQEEGDDQ